MLRMSSSSVARSLLNYCSPQPLPYSTGLPLALHYTTLHKQCSSLGIALPSTLSARASCGLCLTRCPVALIACSVFCSHLLSVYLPLSLFPFLALLSTPISPFSVFFSVCLSNMSFMPCREVSIFNGLWPLSVTLYISLPLHVSVFLSLSLTLVY